MALKTGLRCVLLALALGSSTALFSELQILHHARQYNDAIGQQHFADAALFGGDYGVFSAAYAAQQQGRYQQARIDYGRLEHSENRALRRAALYNMANTYLQQVSSIDLKKDADQALPLLELAKSTYRELLRQDSQYWDAKYNLERALQLSPDVSPERVIELEGRRSPVRTTNTADPDGALP